MKKSTLATLLLAFTGTIGTSHAQTRAAACFFSNDFEASDALNGWDLGPTVERRSPEGEGLGEFVPAWTLGNAIDANADGYFPVPDSPISNRIAMANDAAAPCNCDMANVSLTSPTIDLSGRTGVALECRVFNENTFGAGPSVIEASTVEGEWTTIHTLADVAGAWQSVLVDLSDFEGSASFKLRFRWSDGGNWAGGFAVDDVCIRERNTFDLVVSQAQLGEGTASPFTTGDQRMFYRQLPLSQTAPVTVAAMVKNGGTAALHQVRLTALIDLNGTQYGPFTSEPLADLAPGVVQEVAIATGWQPSTTGTATITITGETEEADEDIADDSAVGTIHFTGAGWDAGYSALSCDNDIQSGYIGGAGAFMVVNRIEVTTAGDHAAGISVRYDTGTQAGAVIRAVLMDALFNTIDTSTRRILSGADLDAIWNGTPLFETFTAGHALNPGDYYLGLQHIIDADARAVQIAAGGATPEGRSAIMEGVGFTVTYLHTAPMVRLHLSAVPVGVAENVGTAGPTLYPNPANGSVQVLLPEGGPAMNWVMTDMTGRVVRAGSWAAIAETPVQGRVDLSALPAGAYHMSLHSLSGSWTSLLLVEH